MQVDEQCVSLFQELKQTRKGPRFLIFKMERGRAVVAAQGETGASYNDLVEALPDNEARWAVSAVNFRTTGNGQRSKVVFFSWVPNTASKIDKMSYAMFQGAMRASTPGVHCVVTAHCKEDLSPEAVLERAARHEREPIDVQAGLT